MTDVIRIVLVDDHPVVRDGLRLALSSRPDMEVVGEAGTAAEAIQLAVDELPDVVVMDLRLPDLPGTEATRRIRAVCPDVRVLVLTMHADDSSVFAAMRAGARGYVLKDAGRDEIERAIRAVATGETILGPAVGIRLREMLAAPPPSASRQPFSQLTDRERDVLELMAQGKANHEIARRLALSPKTVRNKVSTIFSKLHVDDRAQAIVLAREEGLGRDR